MGLLYAISVTRTLQEPCWHPFLATSEQEIIKAAQPDHFQAGARGSNGGLNELIVVSESDNVIAPVNKKAVLLTAFVTLFYYIVILTK